MEIPERIPILVVASLFTSELAAVERVAKRPTPPPIPWRPPAPPHTPPSYRRLEEFFTPEELEEMQEPGYFDEIEEILKKAPS